MKVFRCSTQVFTPQFPFFRLLETSFMTLTARGVLCSVLLFASLAAFAQSKPILIGQTYVKSGPLAALAVDPMVGIKALIEEVNRAGGINGRPLEIAQIDDAYDATRAGENVKKMVADGAVAILMPIGTTSAVGALKMANELKVPLVGPYTGAGPVVKFSEYGFPVRISFDEEYGRIVNHLFTVGVKKIAFAHNDNPGARSAMESTKKFIEQRGEKMLGSVAIQNDGSDADTKAAELAKLKPSAVIFSATNPVTAKFIKAYRAAGADAQFYSFSFLNGQSLHKAIGRDAVGVVVSQVMPYPWNASLQLTKQYQAAMQKIGVKDLSYGSLEGYVSAKVLVEGIKNAGANPTPASVKKSLETFKALNLGGIFLSYTPTEHTGLTFSELTMVKTDGNYAK
jgi:branched-chain amino acid transport system substrate-binding protein